MKIGLCRAFARTAALLFAFLGATSAEAYVDNIHVVPAQPVAGRPVTLAARVGQCHAFTSGGGRRVERDGNQLRAIAGGAISGSGACIVPEHQFRFDLGALEAGTYDVTLVLEDLYFTEQTVDFSAVQFTVGDVRAASTQSGLSRTLLLAALAVAAVVTLRRGSRKRRPFVARSILGAFVALVPAVGSAYVGLPRIEPAHPRPNRPISVAVITSGCHTFFDAVNGLRTVIRTGNRIDVTIEGFEGLGGACPFYPEQDNVFPIGSLPAGSYELHFHFYERDADPESFETGAVLFNVGQPQSIPATDGVALVVAALVILLGGFTALRTRSGLAGAIFVCIYANPSFADDNTLHVLLKAGPGAVGAEDIVEGFDFSSGLPPPLSALAAESPLGAEYLVPTRAQGSFSSYLASHPDSPRARLERFIVIRYPTSANMPAALGALNADPGVEYAHVPESFVALSDTGAASGAPASASEWRQHVNVDNSWSTAGGWALIAPLDSGLATAHPSLRAFSDAGVYTGGNFLPALSADASMAGMNGCLATDSCIEPNVDEREPLEVLAGSNCDPDLDGIAIPAFAGHGTHVAGLISARANGATLAGACKHCGLAMWRVALNTCAGTLLVPDIRVSAINFSLTAASDLGAQVINQSFGRAGSPTSYCQTHPLNSGCVALAHAAERDIVLVAASGNNRTLIQYPASDPRVIAVGGMADDLSVWDRSPQSFSNCPVIPGKPAGTECGSNFTQDPAVDRHQELVAPAAQILSTFYPGQVWNATIGCSDALDGVPGDGAGICTGTSMSAPVVSGVAGILRSINPLVPTGDPDNQLAKPGIRAVLRGTTPESRFGKPWDPRLGFGHVDALAAARAMLGVVGGVRVRNRAIPLFDFHSVQAHDHASVATPQMAVGIGLNQSVEWIPRGSPVAGYAGFPVAYPPATLIPRASAFVVSTEFPTRSRQPPLRPLFLLDRPRPWPLGCTPGTGGCASFHNDHLLVSSIADLEHARADGYRLLGRQGYVFARCAPEPACMPAGSAKLYRQCKATDDDCATFVESEKSSFEANGYTASYPPGSDPVLGYAFPNVDADGDSLIDGFERLIGTNPAAPDSDGDGVADGVEYPLAGVPVSDPCSGTATACNAPPFFDGFE